MMNNRSEEPLQVGKARIAAYEIFVIGAVPLVYERSFSGFPPASPIFDILAKIATKTFGVKPRTFLADLEDRKQEFFYPARAALREPVIAADLGPRRGGDSRRASAQNAAETPMPHRVHRGEDGGGHD